jgi:putative membrane protein
MMDWNGHMSGGGWVFSILGMLILLALVAATVFWIAREFGNHRRPITAMSGSQILERRLASGEIETEEYEQLRKTLGLGLDPASGAAALPPTDHRE